MKNTNFNITILRIENGDTIKLSDFFTQLVVSGGVKIQSQVVWLSLFFYFLFFKSLILPSAQTLLICSFR